MLRFPGSCAKKTDADADDLQGVKRQSYRRQCAVQAHEKVNRYHRERFVVSCRVETLYKAFIRKRKDGHLYQQHKHGSWSPKSMPKSISSRAQFSQNLRVKTTLKRILCGSVVAGDRSSQCNLLVSTYVDFGSNTRSELFKVCSSFKDRVRFFQIR